MAFKSCVCLRTLLSSTRYFRSMSLWKTTPSAPSPSGRGLGGRRSDEGSDVQPITNPKAHKVYLHPHH